MKKKIFSLVAIAAISLGAWNYSENQSNVEISDLALVNIEALANNESGSGDRYIKDHVLMEDLPGVLLELGVILCLGK